jgi:hypothetical protein
LRYKGRLTPPFLKGILAISAFFMGASLQAQVLNYFDMNQLWYQTSSCIETTDDCLLNSEFVYYVDGDTDVVATGQLYKKIRKRGISEYVSLDTTVSGFCTGSLEIAHLAALLRQDGRKIFMYDVVEEQEVLLYDFTLEVGDTLPLTPIQQLASVTVMYIDSFEVDESYLRRFYVSSPAPNLIVEGIGSSVGFLEKMIPDDECTYSHGCYSVNGETKWQLTGEVECVYTVGVAEADKLAFRVFPNPLSDRITIVGLPYGNYTASIFDQSGRKIHSCSLTDHSIDLDHLASGVYVLSITDGVSVNAVRIVKY